MRCKSHIELIVLRSPRGVGEARLHEACKPNVIRAIALQTYGNVLWWSWQVNGPPQYIPKGFGWGCCNGTRFIHIVKISFMTPITTLIQFTDGETQSI